MSEPTAVELISLVNKVNEEVFHDHDGDVCEDETHFLSLIFTKDYWCFKYVGLNICTSDDLEKDETIEGIEEVVLVAMKSLVHDLAFFKPAINEALKKMDN